VYNVFNALVREETYMTKTILLLALFAPLAAANKTDDDLAAALAQNKAQAATITSLKQAIDKSNADAVRRASSATQQRDSTTATIDANASDAQQAVKDQKDVAARIERKAEAAKASADAAVTSSQANNTVMYASMCVTIAGFLGLLVREIFKYASDGRLLESSNEVATLTAALVASQEEAKRLAAEHQGQVVAKLDQSEAKLDQGNAKLDEAAGVNATIVRQTDGLLDKVAAIAKAGGHSQGMLDERNDPGRTGD
jgi:hypothetical protein